LDFGLLRIQYSAFVGYLNRNKREELFLRLRETLGTDYGKILMHPVCNRDVDDLLLHENQRPASQEL
jgi:CRISPR-associated protein Cas2